MTNLPNDASNFACLIGEFAIYWHGKYLREAKIYEYLSKQAGGVSMSFEAITMINQAEESAKKGRAQAIADAKAAEAAAVEAGKAAVEAAVAQARQQVQDLQTQLEAEAKAATAALCAETENQKAAMRACAEGKLDQAAALIVERIVNG